MSNPAQKSQAEVSKQPPTIIVKYTGFDSNEASETYQLRLAELTEFFSDLPPLFRSLDNGIDAVMRDTLYANLLQDVKQKLRKRNEGGYRGQVEIRAFWDKVRESLRIEDDDDSPLEGQKERDAQGQDKQEGSVEGSQDGETLVRGRGLGRFGTSRAKSRYLAAVAKTAL